MSDPNERQAYDPAAAMVQFQRVTPAPEWLPRSGRKWAMRWRAFLGASGLAAAASALLPWELNPPKWGTRQAVASAPLMTCRVTRQVGLQDCSAFVVNFVTSPEAQTLLNAWGWNLYLYVHQWYVGLLQREPDWNEVVAWTNYIYATGDWYGAVMAFVNGPEFRGGTGSNLYEQFRRFYLGFLARAGSTAEIGSWYVTAVIPGAVTWGVYAIDPSLPGYFDQWWASDFLRSTSAFAAAPLTPAPPGGLESSSGLSASRELFTPASVGLITPPSPPLSTTRPIIPLSSHPSDNRQPPGKFFPAWLLDLEPQGPLPRELTLDEARAYVASPSAQQALAAFPYHLQRARELHEQQRLPSGRQSHSWLRRAEAEADEPVQINIGAIGVGMGIGIIEPGTILASLGLVGMYQGLAEGTIAVVLGAGFATFLGFGMIVGGIVIATYAITQYGGVNYQVNMTSPVPPVSPCE